MIKKLLLVLSLCFIPVFAAGCGGAKLVSPDAFAKACEEYDTERYEDVSDLVEDVGNEKLVKAGMFIQAESINIRKVMLDDKVDGVFAVAGDYTMQDLYSGKAEKGTILVKYVKDGDASWLVGGSSLKFASEYEAQDYFKAKVMQFDSEASEDDSGISYLIYNDIKNRSLTTHAFYIEKDCVLSLVGYENKTNDMSASIAELCSYLNIDAPCLEGVDCTKVVQVENRIATAAETCDVTELEPSRFHEIETLPYKTYYVKDASLDDLRQEGSPSGLLGSASASNCRSIDVLCDLNTNLSRATANKAGGYIAMGYRFDDEDSAKTGFDAFAKTIKEENRQVIVAEDTGTDDGLVYYKMASRVTIAYYDYAIYLDGNKVYLICTIGMTEEQAQNFLDDIEGKMGL